MAIPLVHIYWPKFNLRSLNLANTNETSQLQSSEGLFSLLSLLLFDILHKENEMRGLNYTIYNGYWPVTHI